MKKKNAPLDQLDLIGRLNAVPPIFMEIPPWFMYGHMGDTLPRQRADPELAKYRKFMLEGHFQR